MPIPINTRPRYKCVFCTYSATLETVERHEIICWNNPDRYCDNCRNTGRQYVAGGDDEPVYSEPCYYCAQRDDRMFRSGVC